MLYTATLMNYGFHNRFDEQEVEKWFKREYGYPATPEHIKNFTFPLDFRVITCLITNNPGIWLFITITGESEEAFQKFLEDKQEKVMFRSVPTRNWNYNQPHRLMTLYVMDFRK